MKKSKKLISTSAEALLEAVNHAIGDGWRVVYMHGEGKAYFAVLEMEDDELEHACYTCRYVDKQGYEPPCLTCADYDKWEELKG